MLYYILMPKQKRMNLKDNESDQRWVWWCAQVPLEDVRTALSVKIKEFEKSNVKIIFTLDDMSIISYVAWLLIRGVVLLWLALA